VKDVVGDYRITEQLLSMIRSARLVVCDLTFERPNVYFELGFARGIGKKVITIARKATTIHFDVKDWTCIFYSDSREVERDLRARFEIELNRKCVRLVA
jgi:nucleoside 2-deoxyribosyltransferase